MKFTTSLVQLGVAFFSLGYAAAAEFGKFNYTDNGTDITIDSIAISHSPSIEIPETINGKPVVGIGPDAFWRARLTKSVTLPNSIRRIGARAFANTDIRDIKIPDGVTTLEHGVFSGCRYLKSASIPSSVITIGDEGFGGCQRLSIISIPEDTVSIGKFAFSGCYALSKVTLPPSLRTIDESAFRGTAIQSIKIPNTVTLLGNGVFAGCRDLTSASLPSTLKRIPDRFFEGCGLRSVIIPQGVTSIGISAFARTHLENLRLPDGLQTIGAGAFENCSNIRTVTFPKSIRSIGSSAFASADRPSRRPLLGVSFNGNAPVMGKRAFGPFSPYFRVYVGNQSKGFTKPLWKGYQVSMPAPEIAVSEGSAPILIDSGSGVVYSVGNTLVGKKGTPLTFQITNGGSKKLTNIRALTTGGNSADFVVTNLGKSSLKPGASTTVSVRFVPKAKGRRTTILRILSNDADERTFDINLKGTALVPFN